MPHNGKWHRRHRAGANRGHETDRVMVTYIEATSAPVKYTGQIRLYGPEAFEAMRKVCNLTARCLDALNDIVKPGVTTNEIDRFVFEFGMDHDAFPATLNYRGYTKSTCTSINHVVCHGIPNDKPLREGDIVNIDVTYLLDGWHGDSSRMYAVGEIKRASERLLEVTYESLLRGIAAVKPGAKTGAIGAAIQTYAESERCSVVRDFCGHGVGRLFHDAPNILHYGTPNEGVEIKEGMIFTIEPMINLGKPHVKVLADGWTAVTRDRSLTAQYEHTVGVTRDGCEIFTLSPANIFGPPSMR
ncbi:methionine aminopeptidase, type I [Brucella abortus str. 2308 A]|nr:methionine aminopeptidase, type I [Brucella ovis ATCC 25840]EEH14798.1 methionine aminopeptidase, type I [Brucella ceti str. Cudo]EEP63204.1 methionine aminopeptidase, type I [Brucella abortus str. 2308 A]